MGRIILVLVSILFYLWGVTGYNITYLWKGRFTKYFVYLEWEDKEGKTGDLQSIIGLGKDIEPKEIANHFIGQYGYKRVVIKTVQRM